MLPSAAASSSSAPDPEPTFQATLAQKSMHVAAGPQRLRCSPLAAARLHLTTGLFSHRRTGERVELSGDGDEAAEVSYRVGWGPIGTRITLDMRVERTSDGAALRFRGSSGLLPVKGSWTFVEAGEGCCLVSLQQCMDVARVPRFVPLRALVRSVVMKSLQEQRAAAELLGSRGRGESLE